MNTDINLYEILEVPPTATSAEITKSYRRLAKKHHPNSAHNKDSSPEQFQLITSAYEILSDPEGKKKYDHMRGISHGSGRTFATVKEQFKTFIDAQKTVATDEDRALYKKQWEELNKKNKYDESAAKDLPMSSAAAKNKLQELMSQRDSDYNDFKPEKIFDPKMDMKKFNEAFDYFNEGQMMGSNEINTYEAPSAWSSLANQTGGNHLVSYSDLTVDDLYGGEGLPVDNYSGFPAQPTTKVSKERLEQLIAEKGHDTRDYYNNHNVKGPSYQDDIKAKLREREQMTKELETSSVKTGQNFSSYGIFDQLGLQFDTLSISAPEVKKASNSDVKERYEKIKNSRK